jgi:ABC-type glycerol-3-phosphate transport system substrate-binding protein
MNNFQTILLSIFLAFFVFAVLIFSGILPIGKSTNNSNTPQGKVVVWGTFTGPDFQKVFDDINGTNKNLTVTYFKKSPETYQDELINSFANGNGPDLFFITPDMILKNKNFIYQMPYASYPEKAFRDTFIDGAEVYLGDTGVIAMPVVVDPIVLYYNKNIISNAGIAQIPTYWDELSDLNKSLTVKKVDGTISQSMIALGSYDNVNNAKSILATLLMQSGTPIVTKSGGKFIPTLVSVSTSPVRPTEQVLSFYTDFSDPTSGAYSWNRGLLNSKDFFTGGGSAFYIGFASELFGIESINPNLSFDVHDIFQTKNSGVRRTFGTIYGLAVNKNSANTIASFGVAGMMSSGVNSPAVATALSLPPASRVLLATKPNDPYLSTFFNSAIITRGWMDPDAKLSNSIFSELIQNVLSNKLSMSDAVAKAQGQLEILLGK